MTENEAIKNIEDIKRMYTWSTGADDALDMAIEALEKQIPEKTGIPELGISKRHPIIIPCGNCGMELADRMWDYCPYCGQAIDWTEGEG